MTIEIPVEQTGPGRPAAGRSRDAAATRRLLLAAARRRFARDGYPATTVRDIAADVGVNVALINRYFESKEGLFEACLTRAAEDLERPAAADVDVDGVVRLMVGQIADVAGDDQQLQLLLMLRSSGDERAEAIRRRIYQGYAERIAAVAGWRSGAEGAEGLLLRAQIAMAAGLGVVLMRATMGLEPIAGADASVLAGPLGDALTALLDPSSISRAASPSSRA